MSNNSELIGENKISDSDITNPTINPYEKVKLGTTILGFVYNGGVILAADGRTSNSMYVSNRVADKITKICPNIYSLQCGVASDSQFLTRNTKIYMEQFAVEYGGRPPVKVAARILQQYMFNYKHYLSSGLILCGVDDIDGPCVYSVGTGGTVEKRDIAFNGSGSYFIMGFIDKNYKKGMSKEEAKQFAKAAVTLALFRDNSSGGIVRIADITDKGVERFYYPYNELDLPKEMP